MRHIVIAFVLVASTGQLALAQAVKRKLFIFSVSDIEKNSLTLSVSSNPRVLARARYPRALVRRLGDKMMRDISSGRFLEIALSQAVTYPGPGQKGTIDIGGRIYNVTYGHIGPRAQHFKGRFQDYLSWALLLEPQDKRPLGPEIRDLIQGIRAEEWGSPRVAKPKPETVAQQRAKIKELMKPLEKLKGEAAKRMLEFLQGSYDAAKPPTFAQKLIGNTNLKHIGLWDLLR